MATVAVAAPCFGALRCDAEFDRGFRSITPRRVERRAAFDIGSGTTKLLVAEVDVEAKRCVRVVFTRERPVLYGVDARRTGGRLSEDVQQEGLAVLRSLLQDAEKAQAHTVVGVATEVFRRTSNGSEYVARISEELGLPVRVVDQSVEALLGFRTAGAISKIPESELVMWDCGGGSFQLVASPPAGGEQLRMHLGAFGDAVVTAMLVEMQGRSFAAKQSPNPVSNKEACDLISLLLERLPTAPSWLKGSQGVVAIGGRNSMFFLLADMVNSGVCDAFVNGEDLGTVQVDSDNCPESCELTAAAAKAAIKAAAGCSEDDLAKQWCWRPNSDPPAMVLPKLCLIAASLESFGISSFVWSRTVGNCPGIAISEPAELGCAHADN